MRLFVALWPPPAVAEVLAGLTRPTSADVRWTGAANWHVTLRFLGEVDESRLADQIASLRAVGAAHAPRTVSLGPVTVLLGPANLVVPVRGADDLAAAAQELFGPGEAGERFVGHLTLARGRGRHRLPPRLAGRPVNASWTASEVALVSSRPGQAADGGSAYETIATAPLAMEPPATAPPDPPTSSPRR